MTGRPPGARRTVIRPPSRGAGRPAPVPAPGRRRGARYRGLLTAGAAVVLAVILVALVNQYARTYTLAREAARLEQRRLDLIADNGRLRDEMERLQTDDRYLEEIARRQLGLVRPGEVELMIVPPDGPPGRPSTNAGRAAGGTPPPTAMSRPHRGLGVWAAGVRDAVVRFMRVPR